MDLNSFEQRCSQVLEMLGWRMRPMLTGEAPGLVLQGTRSFTMAKMEIGCQCKSDPDSLVSSDQVRDFAGALLQAGLKQGWFFALSDFTQEAQVAAQQINAHHAVTLTLVGSQKLAHLEEEALVHRELMAKELLKFQQETSADICNLRDALAERMTLIRDEVQELRSVHELSQKKISRGVRFQIVASAAIVGLLAGVMYSQRSESSRTQSAGISGQPHSPAAEPSDAPESISPPDVARTRHVPGRARAKASPPTDEDKFLRALPALGRALRAGTLCDHAREVQKLSLLVQRKQPQTSYDNARLWHSIESEIVNCVPGFSEDGADA